MISMQDFLFWFPWVLSAITIFQMYLTGIKHKQAWSLALFNQTLWFIWIYLSSNYGFVAMNIAITVMSVRNHLLWNKPELKVCDKTQEECSQIRHLCFPETEPTLWWRLFSRNRMRFVKKGRCIIVPKPVAFHSPTTISWRPVNDKAPYGERCLLKNMDAGVPYIGVLHRFDHFPTHYIPIP